MKEKTENIFVFLPLVQNHSAHMSTFFDNILLEQSGVTAPI